MKILMASIKTALFVILAGCAMSDDAGVAAADAGGAAPITAEAAGTPVDPMQMAQAGSTQRSSRSTTATTTGANPTTTTTPSPAGASAPMPATGSTTTAATTGSASKEPPTVLSNLSASGPIVVSGQRDVVITGKRISNPSGHCIEIRSGARNVKIVGNQIGPCGQDGVFINSSFDVTVEGNLFNDTGTQKLRGAGSAIEFERSDGLIARSNRMERVATGVYAPVSRRVVVEHNIVRNIQGPLPRGQMVQFNEVNGAGNAVRCNVLENVPGQAGAVEDHISMYASSGTPTDPIVIEHNRTKGGESVDSSGCGIVVGDVSGGLNYRVRGNVFVNTGNCGIGLTAGSNVEIVENIVVSRGQKQANVGLLAWNLYGRGCAGNTFARNKVYWDATLRSGGVNHMWDGGTDKSCQPLVGWNTNVVDATLTEKVFDQPLAACR